MTSSSTSKAGGNTSTPASNTQPPTLPPNVSIFSPRDPASAEVLLRGRVFTRLAISAQTDPSTLEAALRANPAVEQSFCLSHQNAVLVFDAVQDGVIHDDDDNDDKKNGQDDEVKDAHHEHVRAVCLALKDADLSLDIAGCVFDAADALQAGFQFDKLSSGAVLVIDLMSGEDDDDDSDSDLDILAGGEVVA